MKKKKIVALLCAAMMLCSCAYPMEGTVVVEAASITQTDSNGVTWEYEVVTATDGNYAKITNIKLQAGTTKVNIPSKLGSYTVKEIGSAYSDTTLFYQNKELTTVSIPSTVTSIGFKAFYQCTALEKVTFASENSKKRVLTVGSCAFSGCSRLKEVKFPDGLAKLEINSQAFDGCQNLGISEFNCVTSIGKDAFYNCDFTNVVFKEDVSISGSAFGKAFKEEDQIKKTITFEKDVSMGAYQCNAPLAFNPGLTEITFGGEVNLCEGAFQNNINLEKITWGTKLEGVYSSYNTLMGQQVFAGCDNLKTFVFQKFDEDVSISFEYFYGSFPELDTVIYEGDVTTNYWIDAKNVIFKGNVNISEDLSVSSSSTKNIYCYQWDVDLTNLTADHVNFYGILPSDNTTNSQYKLKSYVESQNGSILKNLVSNVKVTNVSDEYSLEDVDAEKITLTPKDLDLEVTAYYVNGSQKEAEIISEGNGYDGYLFSHGALAADLNNDFTVTYSDVQTDFQVLLERPKLTSIIVEMKENEGNSDKQVTVLEGENQLTKEDIVVTAVYDNGTCTDVTKEDSCIILPHTITVGDDNTVMIKYTDEQTNQSIIGKVQVIGTAKSECENIEAVYLYPQNQTGVLVNTTITNKQFEVRQLYNNGAMEILAPETYTISQNTITSIGENTIVVETKDTKRKTTVSIIGIPLGSLSADYVGKEKQYGDIITLDDFDLVAAYGDGTMILSDSIKGEDVHISPEIVTEDMVKNGCGTVQITYSDRIVEVQIPVSKIVATQMPNMGMPQVTATPILVNTQKPEAEVTETPKVTESTTVPKATESATQTPISPLPTKQPAETVKPTQEVIATETVTETVKPTETPIVVIEIPEDEIPSQSVDGATSSTSKPDTEEVEAFKNTKPVLSVTSLGVKYQLTWEWDGEQNPDKYILYYSTDNKDYKILKTVDGSVNSYKYANNVALQGTKVYFRVMAQKEMEGNTISSQISSKVGKYLVDPVKAAKIYSKNQKLYMTWQKHKKCTGYLVNLTVKFNNKTKSKKFRIMSRKKNQLVLTTKQLQKKFKVPSGTKVSVVTWSVQAYYKSGKTYAYSEKVR